MTNLGDKTSFDSVHYVDHEKSGVVPPEWMKCSDKELFNEKGEA